MKILGAEQLIPANGDIRPRLVRILGIPQSWFLPYQVWSVRFIVKRILIDCPPVALIADDMGLGKTHCMLATLFYLKHIIDKAVAGKPLAYLGGKVVVKLESVLGIFGKDKDV